MTILVPLIEQSSFSSGSVAGIAIGSVMFVILVLLVIVGIWIIYKFVQNRQDTKPIGKLKNSLPI